MISVIIFSHYGTAVPLFSTSALYQLKKNASLCLQRTLVSMGQDCDCGGPQLNMLKRLLLWLCMGVIFFKRYMTVFMLSDSRLSLAN